jgi:hypothetical protein
MMSIYLDFDPASVCVLGRFLQWCWENEYFSQSRLLITCKRWHDIASMLPSSVLKFDTIEIKIQRIMSINILGNIA